MKLRVRTAQEWLVCGTSEVLSTFAGSVAECVLAAFVSPDKAAEWLLRVKLFAGADLLAGVPTHNICHCVLVRVSIP